METSNITAGHELDTVYFVLDAALAHDYIAVVDDRSEIYEGTDLVPPTAIAALGVRTILDSLALPPGTVHLGQELSTHRIVTHGQRVSCRAKVAQSSKRGDGLFMVLEFTMTDDQDRLVMEGRTTLMVPGQAG